MKLAIMQPYFFPYLGYIQLVNLVDKFVFYDDVNFIKNGWIARNRIISNTNSLQYFGVNLTQASQNKLINEIKIGNDSTRKLKTIKHVYSRAPFFNDVYPLIEACLNDPVKTIAEMSANSVVKVADYLGIETEFEFSSKCYANSIDFGRSERIVAICKQEKASTYINSIGGVELYSKDYFKKFGINLQFLDANRVTYNQFNKPFESNLSIIDVLMFNSLDRVKEYLNFFDLK
ncbi:hypothetical protein DWB61_03075 [Ancylomarina euxinus]|uniref:Glycine transferase n=1 Tax=Ancylomarina euxinus TaxID=2283627 RepID=A0A425Y6Y1_9BACT|nr:WbqC family protein [Ancylomarina euxinus]MCZ4694014.1 WbqC family protein [Ancylomarina euxinus]MUP14566.1 hypothetical protein [Ancylomarina euxinus]RRG24115.1 hypothetical protein DWB61_03075 [Ancylomarina euxinus]